MTSKTQDGSVTSPAVGATTTAAMVVWGLLVTGCGGGEGSPPQLQTAEAPSWPISVKSTKMSGPDNSNQQWTLTYSSTPGGMATFNGQSTNTSVVSLTASEETSTVGITVSTTEYYLSNPYSPLGVVGTTNGVPFTFLYTSYTPLPSTLTVGASGPLASGTYYDASGTVIGSLTQTYTVTADSSTAVDLDINAAGSLNGVPETETLSYSITASGAATLNAAQLAINGTTVVLLRCCAP